MSSTRGSGYAFCGGAHERGFTRGGGAPNRGGGTSNRGGGAPRSSGNQGRGGSTPYRGGRGGRGNHDGQEEPRVMLSICKLEALEDVPIFKYDVKMLVERDTTRDLTTEKYDDTRCLCAKIMAHVMETTAELTFSVYNRASALYSLTKLSEKEYSYNISEIADLHNSFGDGIIKIVIKPANSFDTTTKRGIKEWKTLNNSLVEAVNIILEQEAFMKPINDEEAMRLEGDVEVKYGLKTSCEILGSKDSQYLAVSFDIKNVVLFVPQTVDLTIEAMGLNNLNVLHHISVRPTYGTKRIPFTIQDISSKNLITNKVPGLEITHKQYFLQTYGINLSKMKLPMVGRRVKDGYLYYPAELLEILPHQAVPLCSQLPSHHDAIIRFSAILPELRYRKMRTFIADLGILESSNLLKFGLRMKPEFISGPCKILKARVNKEILYDNASMKLISFHIRPIFPKWGFVNLGSTDVESSMLQILEDLGVKFTVENTPVELKVRRSPSATDILDAAREQGLKYIFVIAQCFNAEQHDDLKYNEISYQIVTQYLTAKVAQKILGSERTLENNVLKACIKNGGIPFDIEVSNTNSFLRIQTNDVLYVGIAFSHQHGIGGKSRNFKKLPSRIGYAATNGNNPLQVKGDYKYIESHNNERAVQEIKEIMDHIISSFEKNRKQLPRVVCIYVSGFTESQWQIISTDFTTNVKLVLKGIKLLILLEAKNSLARLYRPEVQNLAYSSPFGKAAKGNIQAGLYLAAPVFSPSFPAFYLNPHLVLQGTAKTPKFIVVLNEPNVDLESIAAATHALSFLHGVCLSPTSEPAILTVADRCAERGGTVLKYHMKINRLQEITVEEANLLLTNPLDSRCHSLRYNA